MNNTEFEACIRQYGRDIYSFLCQMTGSRQEADELYQDTFLKFLELEKKLDFERNPRGFLLAIAVNLWKNRRRKYAWRQRITGKVVSAEEVRDQVPAEETSMEQRMISMEQRDKVREAVLRLPDKWRLVVVLFYMEDMKIAEIAELLHLPRGTVKSRLHKAKDILRKELEVMAE